MQHKDALIEQLAERRFDPTGMFQFGYDHLSEHGKDQYRALVRQDWPLIVAFAAEWLKDVEDDRDLVSGIDGDHVDIADMWCEEMGQ